MNRFHSITLCLAICLPLASAQESPQKISSSDHPTLQAALDALPDTGGIVYLAPGTVEIDQPLIVRTPETRIEGSGASTHIINRNEDGKPAFHIRSDGYAKNNKDKLWRIQLGNFRISGNEKSGDGVFAEGIQEFFIHDLSVDRNGGHGIHMIHCSEDPRVTDSIFTYNGKAGIHLNGGHDIVVNANHFEENQDGLQCVDGFNLTCNGNNFDDHLRHGIVIENTYGSVVSGNMIEECQGIAIILDRDCYGITLSANVIAHDLEGGIDLRDAWGCAVSANTFTLVHEFGVRVAENSGRITITGNNFSNSHIGDGKEKRLAEHEQKFRIDTGRGVRLENTEDIVISGNLFSGMDAHAIRCVGDCQRISATGNIIRDYGRREEVQHPIDIPENSGSLVKDNLVSQP